MGCPDYPEALAGRDDALRLARYWLNGRDGDAEDIVQEVYLTLYETRPARATRSYILTRVRWRCLDARRRERRRRTCTLEPWAPAPDDPAREALARVALELIVEVLRDDPGGRLLLLLAMGWPYSDAGARVGMVSPGSTIHRARQRLAVVA